MSEKHIDETRDSDLADDSWDPDTAPDITKGEFGRQFANAPLRRGDPLYGKIIRRPLQDSVQESIKKIPSPMSSPRKTKRR